jgi:peptidoglycan/xylan/chitin deacetylase (PgdA/CDA1 family)
MTMLKFRARQRAGALACLTVATVFAASPQSTQAQECANPNALGTSRVLVVDPREHPRLGAMQYSETLPLNDREVVLTFDDGPIPKHSNRVLEILAAECVKATFFVVGEMARAHPEGVRRMRDGGHTIGTHSDTHPLSMHRMPISEAREQIERGIASTAAALGEQPAPFFRIPGLLRAAAVEDYLAERGLQTWSAEFPADDWHAISPDRVHALAMSRLAARGKGILLLHDIQGRTAAALPAILRDLKAGGYKIVHVVPSSPEQPKTATLAQQWRVHPNSDRVAARRWPAIPTFAFADTQATPAPALGMTAPQGVPLDLPRQTSTGASAPAITYSAAAASSSLPVPGAGLFDMPERKAATFRIAIAMPRPHPPATIRSDSAEPAHDLIGKLIESEPAVTGSIARQPQGVASAGIATR